MQINTHTPHTSRPASGEISFDFFIFKEILIIIIINHVEMETHACK